MSELLVQFEKETWIIVEIWRVASICRSWPEYRHGNLRTRSVGQVQHHVLLEIVVVGHPQLSEAAEILMLRHE